MGRTNVVIQDDLIKKAMKITGAKSKREVIHIALQKIVDKKSLAQSILKLRGKLTWDGDLESMRKNRVW